MTTISLNINNSGININKPELEQLLTDFIAEYIENKEDENLKYELSQDEEFATLNRKLEEKYAI